MLKNDRRKSKLARIFGTYLFKMRKTATSKPATFARHICLRLK